MKCFTYLSHLNAGGQKTQEAIMAADINQIIAGLERDAAGYMAVKCVKGAFFVAAGPGRGSLPQTLEGPWTHLEVAFPGGRDYLAAYEKIYAPVRGMMDRESLHAKAVPVELINKMIQHHGGLVTG